MTVLWIKNNFFGYGSDSAFTFLFGSRYELFFIFEFFNPNFRFPLSCTPKIIEHSFNKWIPKKSDNFTKVWLIHSGKLARRGTPNYFTIIIGPESDPGPILFSYPDQLKQIISGSGSSSTTLTISRNLKWHDESWRRDAKHSARDDQM